MQRDITLKVDDWMDLMAGFCEELEIDFQVGKPFGSEYPNYSISMKPAGTRIATVFKEVPSSCLKNVLDLENVSLKDNDSKANFIVSQLNILNCGLTAELKGNKIKVTSILGYAEFEIK